MKKIRISIFVIILILVASASYFSFHHYKHGAERLTALAVAKNDPTICNEANEAEFMSGQSRDNCYFQVARVNKNITACNYYHDDHADFCFSTVAEVSDDISICNKVNDPSSKGHCYGGFVREKADLSICNPLTDPTAKDACYINYAEVGKVGADFCENNFNTLTNYKQQCFIIAARNKRDVKICDKIQGQYAESERRECIRYIQDTEYRYKNQ